METQQSDTLKELAQVRAQAREQATVKKEAKEELPEGSDPVVTAASAEDVPVEEKTEAAPGEKKEATPSAEKEDDGPVFINGQKFDSMSEAIKYAEKLEQDKLLTEAHAQGVRETLQATQKPVDVKPEDDKFDEEFFTDPKKKFHETEDRAVQKALAIIRAEGAEEAAWIKFSSLHPDLADSRPEVMRILQDNKEFLVNMKDEQRAMTILATKTRSYFDSIVEKRKPRTELPQKSAQVVSPAGGSRPGVTQVKKEEAPLTMAQQLKKLRGRS